MIKNFLFFLIHSTIDGFNYTIDFFVWGIDQYMKFIDDVYDQYYNLKHN